MDAWGERERERERESRQLLLFKVVAFDIIIIIIWVDCPLNLDHMEMRGRVFLSIMH